MYNLILIHRFLTLLQWKVGEGERRQNNAACKPSVLTGSVSSALSWLQGHPVVSPWCWNLMISGLHVFGACSPALFSNIHVLFCLRSFSSDLLRSLTLFLVKLSEKGSSPQGFLQQARLYSRLNRKNPEREWRKVLLPIVFHLHASLIFPPGLLVNESRLPLPSHHHRLWWLILMALIICQTAIRKGSGKEVKVTWALHRKWVSPDLKHGVKNKEL